LTPLQASRKQFYLSLIKLTRLHGGDISVNMVPHSDDDSSEDYGAIILWLPPGKQGGSILTELPLLYRAGFLNLTFPWRYGPGAFHRIEGIYEANIRAMFESTLTPRHIDPKACGFVQMVAANPKYAGNGYASKLMQWRIEAHLREFPDRPVILDTSTEQGVRTYVKMGFELLDQMSVETGTDALGIKLKKHADDGVKEEARRICVQRVMLKIPPT
jgi:GNAT superfamily N-acetyltransferase